MIITSLAALLLAAAPAATDPLAARKAYLACLDDAMLEHLDKKTPPDDFEKAAVATCQPQHDAWQTAARAADTKDGISATQSQKDFDEQVSDYLGNKKDLYDDYLRTNARPVKR